MNWKVGLLTCLGLAAPMLGSGDDTALPPTTKVEIKDSKYQLTAYTMEIPAGWKFAGEIVHTQECHSKGSFLRFTMVDPNSVSAMAFLPGATWAWSSFGGVLRSEVCPGVDIDSAAGFLLNIAIPSLRPQATVMEVLAQLPEVQALLKVHLGEYQKPYADAAKKYGGPPQTVTLDGARVHIQYVLAGQPVEEMISTIVECTHITTQFDKNATATRRRNCNTLGVGITRAPQGHLDELIARYKDLGKSLKAQPDWQSRSQADEVAAFEAGGKRRTDTAPVWSAFPEDRSPFSMLAPRPGDSPLYPLEFRNPDTGQVIPTSRVYNRQWHAHEGTEYTETFPPMNDRRLVTVPFSQIFVEMVVK